MLLIWYLLNQYNTGTMWMALWNTLLIYQRIEKHIPVLLFLIPGWYQFSNKQSMSLQEFIVAGGWTPSYSHTVTVLSLLPGATSWTSLESLPLSLWTPRASVVGGKMRVVGGYCSSSSCSTSSYSYYRAEVMKNCSILVLFVKSGQLREFLWEIFVIGSYDQVQNVTCMDFSFSY